jgi:hypothetical protein
MQTDVVWRRGLVAVVWRVPAVRGDARGPHVAKWQRGLTAGGWHALVGGVRFYEANQGAPSVIGVSAKPQAAA